MTGYTAGATRTAEQERWSNYYLTRDLEQAGPALYLLGSPGRVPVVQGVDSTVVDAVLPIQTAQQAHHPVGTRSKRARRDDQARAYRSKAYYGKTYIVPRSQLIWASMIGIGTSMMVGAAAALAVLHL